MKIGYKSGLFLVVVFIVLVLLALVAQRFMITPGFEDIERRVVRKEMEWVEDLIDRECRSLCALCEDWASWDDTYEYAATPNADYELTNLSEITLARNFLNFIAVIDAEGAVVSATGYDFDKSKPLDIIFEELKAGSLATNSPLMMTGAEQSLCGIASSNVGAALLAVKPILTTDGDGPVGGSLIMARMMDQAFIDNLLKTGDNEVEILEKSNRTNIAEDVMCSKDIGLFQAISERASVYGVKNYIIRLTATDVISQHSKKYTSIIIWIIVILGIFGFGFTYLLVYQFFVSPIKQLEQHIKQIEDTGDLRFIPVGDSDDEISALAREFNDLVERLREEDKAQEQINRKLEQSNHNLSQFARSVSHDLKEPLRVVTSYIQLIEQTADLDKQSREYMKQVVDSSKRMYHMIGELLEYSKSATVDYPLEQCDTGEIVREVLEEIEMLTREVAAEINIDDLPKVLGYKPLLKQIFRNLITNALKYTKDDVKPVIKIGCSDSEAVKTFYVKDNGKGIAPQDQKRIFEMFQRLEQYDKSGTGLGLSICKQVAERHNGQVWVESQEGKGSTFFFSIKTG